MRDLGHVDESHLTSERNEREVALGGSLHEGLGCLAAGRSQLEHHAHDAALGDGVDEAALVDRSRANPEPSGEQDLAAVQQRADIGDLANVHPADRNVEAIGAAHDLRERATQRGAADQLGKRQRALVRRELRLSERDDYRHRGCFPPRRPSRRLSLSLCNPGLSSRLGRADGPRLREQRTRLPGRRSVPGYP
ncbi:MAG TPA: hypothetical protein VGF25_13530 [Thermoleophilaceae bacterium]